MEIPVFICLTLVWAWFLVPPLLRKRREGRPASSVTSFRQQLSTLERATPGTSLRPATQPTRTVTTVRTAGAPLRRSDLQRRRQNVLVGLGSATAFFLLLALVATSAATILLFLASAGALGAYVYALVQIRMRADEAAVKVRVLRPQAQRPIGARPLAVRRSASN